MDRIGTWSALFLALSGCGAGPIANDDEVDTTESDTDDVGTDDAGTESSDTGSDTGDGDGDGDTETDTGPLECPPREVVTARFRVMPSLPMTATCTVTDEVDDGGDIYALMLDCEGTSITVSFESTIVPKPYADVGDMVALDYRVEASGRIVDRWLAIHRMTAPEGTLVLGAVAASTLDPPDTTLGQFFGDPTLTIASEQPCEPVMDPCGEFIRLGLDVSLEMFGPADPVFSQGSWYADFLAFGYSIVVEAATRRLPPITCSDVSDEWYQLAVVWFPSD